MMNATMPVKDLDAESRIELPKSLFDPFPERTREEPL